MRKNIYNNIINIYALHTKAKIKNNKKEENERRVTHKWWVLIKEITNSTEPTE